MELSARTRGVFIRLATGLLVAFAIAPRLVLAEDAESGRSLAIEESADNIDARGNADEAAQDPSSLEVSANDGVWWQALCECSDDFNWIRTGLQICLYPNEGLPDFPISSACSAICQNHAMRLTSSASLGPQQLGSCEPVPGNYFEVPLR